MIRNLFLRTCAALLCAGMTLVSCDPPQVDVPGTDPDDQENVLEPLLKEAAKSLGEASSAGRIVDSVGPETAGEGGFRVTFTDGSSVLLGCADRNAGGVTPLLAIDKGGYWTVSYNGGSSAERILSSAALPMDAADVGVQVDVDDDGRYVFRFHTPGYPSKVTETVRSTRAANAASVLQSCVMDSMRSSVLLTLADGSVFSFVLDYVRPAEITLLRNRVLLSPGGEARVDFVVGPSDARFSPVVSGEEANLLLLREDGSAPTNFRIVKAEGAVDDSGKTVAGMYSVTIGDLNLSKQYTETVTLVLLTENRQGEPVRLSSQALEVIADYEPRLLTIRIGTAEGVETEDGVFHVRLAHGTNVKALRPEYETNGANVLVKDATHEFTPAATVNFSNPVTVRVCSYAGQTRDYTVVVHYSALPVVYVTTPSRITSKDNWTEGCGIQIWNAGELNGTYYDVQMKGRGNSTWSYSKKPYAIKLDKKAEVLGMKKHKRWCLLANYLDHTCLRNAVAFEIARRLPGLDWTPSGRFVELVMNGEFQGNYFLCEQIKVDANRVDIAEISPKDVAGEAVTGGYLFELDTYYDELFKFHTSYRYLPVQFKDPDEDIAAEQFEYVRDYFNRIEAILYGGASGNVFDYIDMDSFIDWFLVNTLTGNREPKHPKSSYMNKDRGGKLKAGPVWDYDWETFLPNGEGLINATDMWYDALFRNAAFVARLKERWNTYKGDIEDVGRFIDESAELVRESAQYNAGMWPLWGNDVNGDGSLSFDAAVARLKQAFKQKIELNDKAINAL